MKYQCNFISIYYMEKENTKFPLSFLASCVLTYFLSVSGVDAVLLRPSDSCKRRHTAVRADTRAAFAQFMQNIKLKNKQTKIDDQNQSVYLNLGSQL